MDVVQRPLQADGIKRLHGEIVDAGAWKHASKLREQRYIAPFSGKPVKCKECGRKFADKDILQNHIEKEHGLIISSGDDDSSGSNEPGTPEGDNNDMDLQSGPGEQQ